jgi:two-component system sensor histidine kinase SenX3
MVAVILGALVAVVALSIALAVLVRRLSVEAGRMVAVERERNDARTLVDRAEETSRRLRDALDAIPQGVLVTDASGEILARNTAAADVEGGRHSDALVRRAVDDLLVAARRGAAGTRTVELYGPPARVVEVTAQPLPGGALVVVDDISESRRLEAVRRDLVANLSHELKTPVGAIGLLAETLLSETDPEVAQRLTERVVNESFRVSRAIDDLLELSRIEATGEIVHQPVPVHLILEEAADRQRPVAERRDISIHVGGISPRATTLGDRRQLVSAVANLLDNAVKYSHPGSEVELRAAADGSKVTIQVEDHGLGIPARDVDRIFERFYRVDRARSRDTGGTGLGLAIVRHVAVNHNGEVTVESVEGRGSTFSLVLPAGPGPVALHDPASHSSAPRRTA